MNFTLLPGRVIRPKPRGATGQLTLSDRSVVVFESSLERALIIKLDIEAGRVIRTKPFTLQYDDQNGRKRRYMPDLIVQFAPHERRRTTVMEVTPLESLAKLAEHFEAMRAFCAMQEWGFQILTEEDIFSEEICENMPFLKALFASEPPLRRGRAENSSLLGMRKPSNAFSPADWKPYAEQCSSNQFQFAAMAGLTELLDDVPDPFAIDIQPFSDIALTR